MEPSFVIIGLNDRSANAAVRARFRMDDASRTRALQELVRAEGIDEIVILSGVCCTEFILWASNPSEASNSILRFLTREFNLKLSEWSEFYRLVSDAALMHLFRMLPGLDSAKLGDPQIAPIAREMWEQAQKAATTGRFLDSIFERALAMAERVRQETKLGSPDVDASEATRAAEVMLRHELSGFRSKLTAENTVPTILALRHRLEEICGQELKSLEDQYGPFTEDQQAALHSLASHITQRIAGSMARELKEPEKAEQAELATMLQRLFQLQPEKTNIPGTKH